VSERHEQWTDRRGEPAEPYATGEAEARLSSAEEPERASVVRHEERAEIDVRTHESGSVRVRKQVDAAPVEETVRRNVEHAEVTERVPVGEGDSGEVETLEDGSISIPVFEEVLVVTKKMVVRERVIVRKRTVVDEQVVRAQLRREHVTIEGDDGVEVEDRRDAPR